MTDSIISELEKQYWRERPKAICFVNTTPMYITQKQHDAALEEFKRRSGKDVQPPITFKGRELRVKS